MYRQRSMRKVDLPLSAGLTANVIFNIGRRIYQHGKTLRFCWALDCDVADVIRKENLPVGVESWII